MAETKSDLCAVAGCNKSGTYGHVGSDRRYCGDHLWIPSSPDPGQTCDMALSKPPFDSCGQPAAVKWTSVFGDEARNVCKRCSRKHFRTDAERAEDEAAEKRADRNAELWSTYVFTPVVWVFRMVALAMSVYGAIWFIHWCWRNS